MVSLNLEASPSREIGWNGGASMLYSKLLPRRVSVSRCIAVVGRIESISWCVMNPQELYRAGHLTDAIKALSAELRDNPTDVKRRTFLFELLAFAGEFERADKQLEVLAQAGPSSEMGVLLYRSALYAERKRHDVFERGEFPASNDDTEPVRGGVANGKPFNSFADADPRTGAMLEIFAAGNYLLLPLAHVASIQIQPPQRLRDLLWTPAAVRTTPSFKGTELGEVLLPVLAPFSWRHPDEAVRLGRMTVWEKTEGYEYQVPFGQKMWLVDEEEISFLELRALEFNEASVAA